MINNEKELIIEDILKLRKKKKYEIDDLEIFLDQFKSDLMKKYLKGLIESEPESQLRATLLNSETHYLNGYLGKLY